MRAVYVDESGRGNDYYFFGALIVDDRSILRIERGLNDIGRLIAENVPGFDPRTEFHGKEMFHGHDAWRGVPVGWRAKACELVTKVVEQSGAEFMWRGLDLNAHRARYVRPYPAHLLVLAQILARVDQRLATVHRDVGIVLADDHHSAATSRRNLVDFKIASVPGYTSRAFSNLADTIYFGPSHASRLIQAADVATYFVNRRLTWSENDPRATAGVQRCFDRVASVTVHRYMWSPRPEWR